MITYKVYKSDPKIKAYFFQDYVQIRDTLDNYFILRQNCFLIIGKSVQKLVM